MSGTENMQPTKRHKPSDYEVQCESCSDVDIGAKTTCSVYGISGNGIVGVSNVGCEHDGCQKQPLYAPVGEKRARACGDHRPPEYINVKKRRRCEHDGCTTTASFAPEGAMRGVRCYQHKLIGDVGGRYKNCEYAGCGLTATFALQGSKRAVRCFQHKNLEDVDVRHGRCEYDGCNFRPSFASRCAKIAIRCSCHKKVDDIDVRHSECQAIGCNNRASFAKSGETKAYACAKHKQDGDVDVKHRRCDHAGGCVVQASFGFPGKTPTACSDHKLAGMMREPRSRCDKFSECGAWSTHGITKPSRCEIHALPGDDNMVEKECSSCNLVNMLNEHGKCEYCAPGTWKHLGQQRVVVQHMKHALPEYPMSSVDKTPPGLSECGRRERPDLMWDIGHRIVIVEVDENQHCDRPCECEQVRMVNVTEALQCERTVWIRYNPDKFAGEESRKWSKANKRLNVLKEWVLWALTVNVDELKYTCSVIHLFFDGYQHGSVDVVKLPMASFDTKRVELSSPRG